MMQGLMVRGLLRMAVVLGMRDQRMFELEGELQRIRNIVGEAWLKASDGDIAAAVELKCERLEKDGGDAEAECRELHRKLDEVRQEAELFPLKILVKEDGDSIVVASEQTLCSLGDEVEALYNSVADDLRRGDFEIVSSLGLWLKPEMKQ